MVPFAFSVHHQACEGPWANSVFLMCKVKTSGPTSDDYGGTHAIGLAQPLALVFNKWMILLSPASLHWSLALLLTPQWLSKLSIQHICCCNTGTTTSTLKTFLFLSNPVLRALPSSWWVPGSCAAVQSTLHAGEHQYLPNPQPLASSGPSMPSPSKPMTPVCLPPSPIPWLQTHRETSRTHSLNKQMPPLDSRNKPFASGVPTVSALGDRANSLPVLKPIEGGKKRRQQRWHNLHNWNYAAVHRQLWTTDAGCLDTLTSLSLAPASTSTSSLQSKAPVDSTPTSATT